MMQHEFEALAGYEVSYEDYTKIIEPMYMAVGLSKQEFVKCIDRKRFALKTRSAYIKDMQKYAKRLKDNCTHFYDEETETALENTIAEFIARFYRGCGYYESYEEKQSCHYPYMLSIFTTDYKTIDKIYFFT